MSWRDAMCGELRAEDAGRRVTLAGWANARRDHGGLVFVDLRDHTGVVQLVLRPENIPVAHSIRNEFVLQAEGEIVARAPEAVNPNIATGDIELQVDTLSIVSTSEPLPFQIGDESVDEVLRLRYRYLDMRGERMQRNLRLNHTIINAIRRTMDELGVRRRVDAEHDEGHARGRARLPRPGPAAARHVLRARAVAAALQAAVHGRRARPLLPDRDVLA